MVRVHVLTLVLAAAALGIAAAAGLATFQHVIDAYVHGIG